MDLDRIDVLHNVLQVAHIEDLDNQERGEVLYELLTNPSSITLAVHGISLTVLSSDKTVQGTGVWC